MKRDPITGEWKLSTEEDAANAFEEHTIEVAAGKESFEQMSRRLLNEAWENWEKMDIGRKPKTDL